MLPSRWLRGGGLPPCSLVSREGCPSWLLAVAATAPALCAVLAHGSGCPASQAQLRRRASSLPWQRCCLAPGDTARMILLSGLPVEGRVAWTDGLSFDPKPDLTKPTMSKSAVTGALRVVFVEITS